MERWLKIPGFADEYEVSSFGRVRRLAGTYETTFKGRAMTRSKPAKFCGLGKLSTRGYPRVNLGGEVRFVHRIVALAFLPNPDGLPQINHKNGVKTDNRPENLEWCTNQQNRDHAVATGLHHVGQKPAAWKYQPGDVAEMQRQLATGASLRAVGRSFGTSHGAIRKAISRA
jgi:hypothetical protein